MQKVKPAIVLASVLTLTAGTIHLAAQQQPPAQPQTKPQEQHEQRQGQKESVVTGHLVRVDAKAKTFTIRTDQHMQGTAQASQPDRAGQPSQADRPGQPSQTDRPGQASQADRPGQPSQTDRPGQKPAQSGRQDMQLEFAYNDATKVTGSDKNIEGLATMTEANVTVHYTMQGGKNMATWVEVKRNDSPRTGSPRNEPSKPDSPRPDSPRPDSPQR